MEGHNLVALNDVSDPKNWDCPPDDRPPSGRYKEATGTPTGTPVHVMGKRWVVVAIRLLGEAPDKQELEAILRNGEQRWESPFPRLL
jgi:hypothetical protein